MDIINYKLKDLLKQDKETIERYIAYLTHLKPISTENEVFYLKLREVEYLKTNIANDMEGVVAVVQGIPKEKVLNMHVLEFFGLYNSIRQQLERISKAEQNGLSGGGDPRFEAVDGNKIMAKYGIYNTIIPLAEQFSWTLEQVLDMKYNDVFTLLLYNKDRAEITQKMNKIKI